MTGEILEAVLTKLNHRMSSSGRSIILLMDNAGCHPDDLAEKFHSSFITLIIRFQTEVRLIGTHGLNTEIRVNGFRTQGPYNY